MFFRAYFNFLTFLYIILLYYSTFYFYFPSVFRDG